MHTVFQPINNTLVAATSEGHQPLDAFFAPTSVAVIGATDAVGSVGRTVLWNLINHPFGGTVFPVNPNRANVLGIKAYPSIREVPEPVEQPLIKEIDINPLFASSDRLLALDARVILHGSDVRPTALPKPAIRPYPSQYVAPWTLNDGMPVIIRPIRPEDEPLMVEFHRTLSPESVFFRYFYSLGFERRVSHERLARMCFIDYDRAIALVVEDTLPDTHAHSIRAVGRLTRVPCTNDGEFALLVSDLFQHHGIGHELLKRLIAIGRVEGMERIIGSILPTNRGMRHICDELGFTSTLADDVVQVSLMLRDC